MKELGKVKTWLEANSYITEETEKGLWAWNTKVYSTIKVVEYTKFDIIDICQLIGQSDLIYLIEGEFLITNQVKRLLATIGIGIIRIEHGIIELHQGGKAMPLKDRFVKWYKQTLEGQGMLRPHWIMKRLSSEQNPSENTI